MSTALTDDDLEPGDILLCKNYGAIPGFSMNFKHLYIRGMQAVTTHNEWGGSSNTVHAAVAYYLETPAQQQGQPQASNVMHVFESTGVGIVESGIADEAMVFRPREKALGSLAAAVGKRLFERKQKAHSQGKQFGKYNFKRGVIFQFLPNNFGSEARERIASLVSAVLDEEIDGKVIKMVCSGFATFVHQVACAILRLAVQEIVPNQGALRANNELDDFMKEAMWLELHGPSIPVNPAFNWTASTGHLAVYLQNAINNQMPHNSVPMTIKADGANMTPKALEAYLRVSSKDPSNPRHYWEKAGRFNRPTGAHALTRWRKRLLGRDNKHVTPYNT